MSLYDTVAHEFQREQWFVGTCKNKEVTHQRLLERGDVGDFVIRISERGGYTLICKIGAEKLSFKHLMQNPDGTIQMEGSKHVLPDMDEMLRLIKPLAKRPSREIVVDDASEDTYLETQDNVADYDFGSRTEDSNAGGYFEVSPIYDDASNYVGIEPEDVEEITEVDPVYDAAGGGEDGVDYDAATAEGQADYDEGTNLYGDDPLYDDAVGGAVAGGDPLYDDAAGGNDADTTALYGD